jgi:hypothetical protein
MICASRRGVDMAGSGAANILSRISPIPSSAVSGSFVAGAEQPPDALT